MVGTFSREDWEAVAKKLDTKLDADEISYRQSAQGGSVAYVEGWRIISLANGVFGFNGWSSEILEQTVDFCDDVGGKYNLGVTCRVRVTIKDGAFHDDIGYGMAENQRSKGSAYEKAKKEAVTDAVKRALRQFGDRLGNCTYDKVFLRDVREVPPSKPALAQPNPSIANAPAKQAPKPPAVLSKPAIRPPPAGAYLSSPANPSDAELCNMMQM